MTCSHCGREGPDGRFCTWCGTRHAAAAGARKRFAAAPTEVLLAPGVITTLFPHLAENGVNEFRWALGAGLVLLAGLYVAGLITAALVVAAILVPVLYVMYLYEARVYRDAPVPVTLATIGGGFVVGIVATLVIEQLVGSGLPLIEGGAGIPGIGPILVASVLVPIAKEAIKPIPALLLRNRADFSESIDGLVFGVAAGLGYAAAETIIHFSAIITSLPVLSEPGLWIVTLLTVGLLMPLLHGSATGLITVALWRGRDGGGSGRALVLGVAVLGHVAFALGSQLIELAHLGPVAKLAWQAVVVGGLLIAVRIVLDRLLREEASSAGLSELACPNCGAEVMAAGFCTACGVALSATPHATGVAGETRSRAVAGRDA